MILLAALCVPFAVLGFLAAMACVLSSQLTAAEEVTWVEVGYGEIR